TRQGDDDVLSARADLRLGDTRGVDALTDDRDRLVELLLRDRLAAFELWGEDDLGSALKVERELGCPACTSPQHASAEDGEKSKHDHDEPREGSLRLLHRRGSCCHVALCFLVGWGNV